MKKKILMATLCVILILSMSVPCFASGWEWWTYNEPINPTRLTLASAQFQGYYTESTQDTLIEMVNIATKCNAFGGYLPVYITMTISDPNGTVSETNGLSVWCIAPTDLQSSEPLTNVTVSMSTNADTGLLTCVAYGSANSYRLFEFAITSNGSFTPTGNAKNLLGIFPYVNNGTATQRLKLVGVWGGSAIGMTRFNDDVPSLAQYYTAYYAGSQYADKTWTNAETMLSHWQQVQTNVTEETSVSYELNLPAIITAIPAGAKAIIDNAFGFNIFGINVAGLLSVILVVVIIGFVIKWLTNR